VRTGGDRMKVADTMRTILAHPFLALRELGVIG
jgi:hypothetical protein